MNYFLKPENKSFRTRSTKLTLMATGDVHGHFFPAHDAPLPLPTEREKEEPLGEEPGGLARAAHYVQQQRLEPDTAVMLFDVGDMLQGTLEAYYEIFLSERRPLMVSELMNRMQYDAAVVGNHDLEAGPAVWQRWHDEIHFPLLCANIIDQRTHRPLFRPYIVVERGGWRVAVLGLITNAVPCWVPPFQRTGLQFTPMLAAARQWLRVIHEQEHPDCIVGLIHSGAEGGIQTSDFQENATLQVVRQTTGFDAVFFGHDHLSRTQPVRDAAGRTVWCLNCSSCALQISQLTLTHTTGGLHADARLIDVSRKSILPDWKQTFRPDLERLDHFARTIIGRLAQPISTRPAYVGPSAWVDLLHAMQLDATGADISMAAPSTYDARLEAGPLRMSHLFRLYEFENFVCVVRMSGTEIRRYLELSYDRWIQTMRSPDDPLLCMLPSVSTPRVYFLRHFVFNMDSAVGIRYEVDVTQPFGRRVRIHSLSDGRPFSLHRTYRVAMSSYRAQGGGGLLTDGAGIPHAELEERMETRLTTDIHHTLCAYIRRQGILHPTVLGQWQFVPRSWCRPAALRDLRLLFRTSESHPTDTRNEFFLT